ncbi:MAG: alanine racemase [Pseudomonadota bacterium]
MNAPHDQAVLHVSLGALVSNWKLLASRCPKDCGATVKANAYGTGMDRAAPALAEAGCKHFFVATLSEALELRTLLPEAAINVFSGLSDDDISSMKAAKLRPVLNSPEELQAWANAGGGPASLHIDTGMNRLGCSLDDASQLTTDDLTSTGVDRIMSHLACADTPDHALNAKQRDAFKSLAAAFPGLATSWANSGGILNGKDFIGDVARPGIGLYGGNPRPTLDSPLFPVVRLVAPLLQSRSIEKGDPVGYGSTFIAQEPMTVATIGIGYADGLHRIIDGAGHVRVDGAICPILGRISMDSVITNISAIGPQPRGTPVEILGTTTVTEMAAWAGTIDYEILTSISPRVVRKYHV